MSFEQGLIVKGIGGLYTVYKKSGELIAVRPVGAFRHEGKKPMVGDRVTVDGEVFTEILERKNELVRPKVANVDAVVFVIAAVNPKPDLVLLDKLLASARANAIEPILVINKADQSHEEAEAIKCQYDKAMKSVFVLSLEENKSVTELKEALPEGVTVIAGQSGVGKSTLVNILSEKDVMETGSLSKKTDMGKQTTRHSEMFMLPGGKLVIDSPGFSLFDVFNIEAQDLQYYYPEIEGISGACRFMDCVHIGEPGCRVRESVENGEFNRPRYERYIAIYSELKNKEKYKYR